MALNRNITGAQTFTDPILVPDQTKPKASHVSELRTMVQNLVNDADSHMGNYGSDHHRVVDSNSAGFMHPTHLAQINEMETEIDELWDVVDTMPRGVVVAWSGPISSIPNGYALCDGTNGTPDLRNRFILGAGDRYAVGAIGGEEAHKLTIDEMPSHAHTTNIVYGNESSRSGNPWGSSDDGSNEGTYRFTTGSAGGNQPHNNMPPYFALCYIMRVAGSSTVNVVDNVDRDADMVDGYHAQDLIEMINTKVAQQTEANKTQVSILTGSVFHGGIIPLPVGYTQDQCKWFVSLRQLDSGKYTNEFVWADDNRVVTCYDASDGGGWVNYIIVGVK